MPTKRAETSSSPVKVVSYRPRSLKGEVLAPRGSVVVYLAAVGSEPLRTIPAAARGAKSRGKLLRNADAVPGDAVSRVSLRYGKRVLAADVPVPADGSPVRLILPYNGGELISEDLEIVEAGSEAKVSAVAVVHDPPLSRVEQAALLLVPRDKLHLNLGAALPGGVAGDNEEERRRQQEADDARRERQAEQAEARAELAAERAEQRQERREAGGRLDVHFLDQTVIELGPALAAGELLDLRRDLLLG